MDMAVIGVRVRETRKRRGLTQRELSRLSGLSVSLVRKLEQDDYGSRLLLETVHRLAVALGVATSWLVSEPDAPGPDRGSGAGREAVCRALDGVHDGSSPEPDDVPTVGGVRDVLGDAVDALLCSGYGELRAVLPTLLRDADALAGGSAGAGEARARQVRSEARRVAALALGMARQFGAASGAVEMAISDAGDHLTALAGIDSKCWLLLR